MKMKNWLLLLCAVHLLWYGCGLGKAESIVKQANQAAKRKDWKTVQELAEKRVHSVPTDSEATVLLALALFYNEPDKPASIDKAIDCMRQVLNAESKRYDLHFIYGWILLNTGHINIRHIKEARIPLQTAYDIHLKDTHAIGQDYQGLLKYALGRCCMLNGLYDDALKYYEQAAKSTGFNDWSTLYNDMAFCQTVLRNYSAAINNLNLANSKIEKAKVQAELERKRDPNALPYVNPYEYIPVLNTAIICDYLSYPNYNQFNVQDYAAVRVDWYEKAGAMVADAAQKSPNALQQQGLNNTLHKINLRKAALLSSK